MSFFYEMYAINLLSIPGRTVGIGGKQEGCLGKKCGFTVLFLGMHCRAKTLFPRAGFFFMDSYAHVDESGFPVIRIRFTGSKSTDENFQAYLDQNRACYRFGRKLAVIFDASQASVPSLSHQKMQADWLKSNQELMQHYCVGTAYIIPNGAIRAILKMIFSLQKQPVPYLVVKTEAEAEEWVSGLGLGGGGSLT